MRDSGRHRLRCGAFLALGMLAYIPAARAEGIYGSFQTQYQKSDEVVTLVSGSGATRTFKTSQEFWLRTFDLHQQSYLRTNLVLETNLRLSERSILAQQDYSRTPSGALRLVHPYLQVTASHQPSWARNSFSSQVGSSADSTTTRTVTSRNRESLVTGHLAFPNMPRVDLAWVQRVRDGSSSVSDRNRTRSMRVTYDRDRYSVYGTVNEQRISSAVPGAVANRQTVLAGGGTYRLALLKTLSLSAQYDASDVLGKVGTTVRPALFSQSASLQGDWRPTTKWVGTSSYQWRRVGSGTSNAPALTDQEGTLMGRYLFTRRSSLLSGVGFRTARDASTGTVREGFQKYAMALASIDAPFRRRLALNSSLSHTTNWDMGRGPYSVETISGSTRGKVSRAFDADANLQFTMTGDTAAAGAKYASSWSVRLLGRPLRTLQFSVAFRNLRTGAELLRPTAVVRGILTEGNWRPMRTMQLIGQFGWDESLPASSGRSTTRSLTARYEPSSHWQWYGSWTRSDQRVFVSSAGQLSSREVVTTRLQYSPSRRIAVNGALSYNDPGREQESQRVDLTLAWSFGR